MALRAFFVVVLCMGIWGIHRLEACDICGCSSSAFGMGWLPGQRQHFVGMQWTQRSYASTHRVLFADEVPLRTSEFISELGVMGRWSFHPRYQMQAQWGYRMATSTGDHLALKTSGMSDPTWVLTRVFGSVDDTLCARVKHNVIIGAGLEIPIAPSRLRDAEGLVLPTLLQPGSGSWDPSLQAVYTANSTRFGWMLESQSLLSTYRQNGDRRGHQVSLALRYHRRMRLRHDWVMMPHVSAMCDVVGREWRDKQYNNDSGGWSTYARIGLDMTFRSWTWRSYMQAPVLHEIADGLVRPEAPLHFSVIYIIQNKNH